eukprot:1157520-Pelagomonas_calceolata.AAC.2
MAFGETHDGCRCCSTVLLRDEKQVIKQVLLSFCTKSSNGINKSKEPLNQKCAQASEMRCVRCSDDSPCTEKASSSVRPCSKLPPNHGSKEEVGL